MDSVNQAAACRPLGGGWLGLETLLPLPLGGHCTHLVQAPQLQVQSVSFSEAGRPDPLHPLLFPSPSRHLSLKPLSWCQPLFRSKVCGWC